MAITLYPVQKETVRSAPWNLLDAALDHGSDTADPVFVTDETIDDPNVIYRYNGDSIINSTETLADIPDLAFPIAAREIWAFEYEIEYQRVGTCTMDIALVAPAGVQIYAIAHVPRQATPTSYIMTRLNPLASTVTALLSIVTSGTLSDMPIRLVGVAIGVTAGGSVQVQFSKGDAAATQIVIQNQSTLIARRIIS